MRRVNRIRLPHISWPLVLLALILVTALGLRLHGIDWDSGYGFHPDERSLYMRAGCIYDLLTERPGYESCLADYPETQPGIPGLRVFLDFDRSPLNPHWFPLGSVLLYILVLFRSVVELFTDINALDMRYVGRALSALADVGSVFLVYLLGRRIYSRGYGPWVGLLAAALTALAVIHVQNSHFFRPETFSAFMVLAVFWALLQVMERRRLLDSLLLGLALGLALAPKVSILLIGLPALLVYGFRLWDGRNIRWSRQSPDGGEQVILHALAAGTVALAVFFIVTPYGLLNLSNFIGEQAAQTEMARNAGLWPFTIQYVDTPAFLYQFHQTAVWGLGLPLGLFAWAGVVFTAVLVWRGTDTFRADLLLAAWVIPGILFLETFEVRFQRYYFALIPFMILLGARLLLWLPFYFVDQVRAGVRLGGLARSVQELFPGALWVQRSWGYLWHSPGGSQLLAALAWTPLALVVVATAFYSLAFQQVYANPHPAVAASQWINDNLPRGTAIVSDNHWDEFVPELYSYDVWQFPAYEPDNVAKMAVLGKQLADAEYLVFYSHRPYVSVARDPERFPFSINYYRQLFGGELGYRLDRTFTSYPSLAGIAFVDDPLSGTGLPRPEPITTADAPRFALNLGYADDNVVGYDHPRVLLFRNVERLPAETLLAQLVSAPMSPPAGLKLSEEAKLRQQEGGTWSELFDREGWANRHPVLSVVAWLLVVELIYLAALPLALFLFRPLADRGLLLGRILGLLGAGYIAWLIVSLGWMEFSRIAIGVGILGMALLSGLAFWARWREMTDFLVRKWRLLLTVEALFLLAFLAFVAIRSLNPDLWHPYRGGEKPMELAYFNAIVRSTLLPPYDPWFAGGYLNYYYWGYFILALPTRLLGVIPTVAFNLAVPLFFALTVTGAFSIVYNLAEGVRRSRRPALGSRQGTSRVVADEEYAGDFTEDLRSTPGNTERVIRSPLTAGLLAGLFVAVIGNLDGMLQLIQGIWGRLSANAGAFPSFDFWRSSRMLPNLENFEPGPLAFWVPEKIAGQPDVSWHITEFPFFTFLFSDLHAHLMVIPFALLAIGLGLNLTAGWRRLGWAWDVTAVTLLGLAVGALWLINSWDYPSYLALALALAGLAVYSMPESAQTRLTWGIVLAVGIALVSMLAYWPFHQAVETFDAGIEATKWQTPFVNYLGIHGLFLFIIGAFLVWQARRPLFIICGRRFGLHYLDVPVAPGLQGRSQWWLRSYFILGLLAALYLALAGYWTGAILLFLLLITGLVIWDGLISGVRGRAYAVFPLALLALALALGIGVDLVRLQGDIGRMNTLFKYYLEAWVLFSLAASYMLWRMGYDGRFRPVNPRWPHLFWLGVVALLILSSLIYTGLGTWARVSDRFNDLPPTLDGMAYMEQAVHWEKDQPIELKWDGAAIRWMQDNVAGSPVVLEAHTEQYRWGGRIANYTGLPTVLGWPWHQIQQRGVYSDEIRVRAGHVREMYETEDLELAESLLRQYDVRYVVVGDLERIFYPGDGLAKFDRMAERGAATRVFDNGHVTIYQLAGQTAPAANQQ